MTDEEHYRKLHPEYEGLTPEEVDELREQRTDEYFKQLHPEYDSLTPEEQKKLGFDRYFIRKNIDFIDLDYKYRSKDSHYSKLTGQEKIEMALIFAKQMEYKKLLHFDHGLSRKQYLSLFGRDPRNSEKYFGKIDEYFAKYYMEHGTIEPPEGFNHLYAEEMSDVLEELKKAVEEVKIRIVTPKEIGKATINAPTKGKEEAENMESGNKRKEGDEIENA